MDAPTEKTTTCFACRPAPENPNRGGCGHEAASVALMESSVAHGGLPLPCASKIAVTTTPHSCTPNEAPDLEGGAQKEVRNRAAPQHSTGGDPRARPNSTAGLPVPENGGVCSTTQFKTHGPKRVPEPVVPLSSCP